ncbi:MAG: hypothetical protein HYV32_05530 [Candidatus Kerfeldbacteria bacterium]|nr:hypothetical protein [Candidatus Kerfeldbacteria bacterium]
MEHLTGLRQKVFFDRYALKDENGSRVEDTPEQMWHRVARGIASIETTVEKKKEWEEKFYQALEGFKFLPGGRILAGAGSGVDLTFYNCYVIPSPEDSRGGIFDSVKTMVEIMSRGGGVGVNLSSLRPRGAYVKGVNGTASGAVSFGGLYSHATGLVIQGGSRRGALMLMLNDDHPDIEEFITVKRTMGLVTNANLSVCVSDRFMEAVEQNGDWDLKWGGKVYKTIKARTLWDLICESAHASGEPGLVFMERYNKESNTWYFEKIICVNPCVTGDTRVSTTDGLKTIKALYEAQQQVNLTIDSRLGAQSTERTSQIIETGIKDVYRLQTKEGYELKLTANHQVRTARGWVEAQHLQTGDQILLLDRVGGFGTTGDQSWGQVLGWFIGDGHFNQSKHTAVLSFFGEEKREVAPRLVQAVNGAINASTNNTNGKHSSVAVTVAEVAGRDEARISSQRLNQIFTNVGMTVESKLRVPQPVWEGTAEMQKGFLQGLFTADGHVAGSPEKGVSIRLTSISEDLLKEVQQLLLNFGIVSRLYANRRMEQVRELPDGRGGLASYPCQAQHDLVISKAGLKIFATSVGFLSSAKQQKLTKLLSQYTDGPYTQKFVATFVGLEHLGQEMVYDLTEPVTHSFAANGLIVHNCGEQGLGAWSVCNLGAVNLAAFVNDGVFDTAALKETVHTAIRFLDNVIDSTPYFFKENEEMQKKIRRTGLGTMGLGDALIKMKIRYGSEEAVAWCEEVYRVIRDESYRMSMEIAKEKGAFPGFESEKYMQGKFIQRLPRDLQADIAQFGVRNAVILTQAPTGTTSILAGVSSGIEPVYDFAFKRKDRLGEHIVYHPLYEEWRKAHPNVPEEEKPAYFVSAKELSPMEHVNMQAVAQKYTDSSISKTVNAPNEHTMEQVKELYMQAYKMGCKGVTYYRDGSRDISVLESLDKKDAGDKKEVKKEEVQTAVPAQFAAAAPAVAQPMNTGPGLTPPSPRSRPEMVPGFTYKIKTGYGTMFVTINHDEAGRPFEVFATIGKSGGFFAAKSEAICRLVSLALRSGIPVETVVDQIKGIRGPAPTWGKNGQILSIADAIAQVLANHVNSAQGTLNLQFAATPAPLQTADELLGNSSPVKTQESVTVTQTDTATTHQTTISMKASSIADAGVAPECPECGSVLAMAEGCMMCHGCGYSKCA